MVATKHVAHACPRYEALGASRCTLGLSGSTGTGRLVTGLKPSRSSPVMSNFPKLPTLMRRAIAAFASMPHVCSYLHPRPKRDVDGPFTHPRSQLELSGKSSEKIPEGTYLNSKLETVSSLMRPFGQRPAAHAGCAAESRHRLVNVKHVRVAYRPLIKALHGAFEKVN